MFRVRFLCLVQTYLLNPAPEGLRSTALSLNEVANQARRLLIDIEGKIIRMIPPLPEIRPPHLSLTYLFYVFYHIAHTLVKRNVLKCSRFHLCRMYADNA
jgi:hypothetical protein